MKKLKDIAERDGYPSVARLMRPLIFNQRAALMNVYEYCDIFRRTTARTDEQSIDDIVSEDIMDMLNESGRLARYLDEIDSGFEEI